MEEIENKRLAVLSVIVEDRSAAESINVLLSEYGEYVVGRMGIPYKAKGVSVICVVLDATAETVNALTGKIGRVKGVSAKTLFSKF